MKRGLLVLLIVALFCGVVYSQAECGPSKPCGAGNCCSQWGFCGNTAAHCTTTATTAKPTTTTTTTTTTAKPTTGTTGTVRKCTPVCASNECCSQWGYCGKTAEHCAGTGAASTVAATTSSSSSNTGATTGSSSCKLSQIFTQADFTALFPNANAGSKNTALKNQKAIFTYDNLIAAANYYPLFACDGDTKTRKRELAAFLAQTSQETSGWWSGQQYVWGYVYSTELGPSGTGCDASACPYCQSSSTNPCTPGIGYYGRGPLQLSWNYNYGPVSRALFNDNRLLSNPDEIINNGVTAFRTSLWFWMTAQNPKPSCHDVIVGKWTPSSSDVSAGRVAGFGMTTNIINGGLECSVPTPQKVENRVQYFDRYTKYFGQDKGSNFYCNNMQHY